MSQKRQEIIAASAVLMESRGYENTKLSDILEASHIGKGQFYYYFSSKRDLGLAVIDYFFESFNKELLGNILGSEKAPETKLNEMLAWIVALHQSKQARCGCVFGNFALEMSEHDDEFRQKVDDVFSTWVGKLRQILEEMCASSECDDPDERTSFAQSIVAMIEGGILLMKSKQDIGVLEGVTHYVQYLVHAFAESHAAPAYGADN